MSLYWAVIQSLLSLSLSLLFVSFHLLWKCIPLALYPTQDLTKKKPKTLAVNPPQSQNMKFCHPSLQRLAYIYPLSILYILYPVRRLPS